MARGLPQAGDVRAHIWIVGIIVLAGCGGGRRKVGTDGAVDSGPVDRVAATGGSPGDTGAGGDGAGGTGGNLTDGRLDDAGRNQPDGRVDSGGGGVDGANVQDAVTADRPAPDGRAADSNGASSCPGDRRPAEAYCNPATARPCTLSTGATCRCEPICGGPAPLPGMDYTWICRQPEPAACPRGMPADGQSCGMEGLSCSYGATAPRFCSGWIARCQGGRWMVTYIPPPP